MDEFLKCGAIVSLNPSQLLVGWGKRRWSASPGPESFYFPDFFLKEPKAWFTHEHQEVISKLSLPPPLKGADFHWENPYFGFFSEQFKGITLEKAVPYVFAHANTPWSKEKLNWCLTHLLSYIQKHPVYAYGFWDEHETILGATPEKLFSLEKGIVKSVALAGTKRTGEEPLAEDPKENREHRLVIDGIEQALSPFGKVKIGNTEVINYSTLKHLVTPIDLDVRSLDAGIDGFYQLVHALHPTPALGAYPKEAGKEWLERYQTLLPRKRFGAPVGYWRENAGQCYVAIRNVQREGERWQIGAGCGVVKESKLEKEWSELNLKIDATRKILAI